MKFARHFRSLMTILLCIPIVGGASAELLGGHRRRRKTSRRNVLVSALGDARQNRRIHRL